MHNALRRLIYERGNIDQHAVDVSFEMPTRERIERLTRPTLYVFLYDIQENLALRQSSIESMRDNGRAIQYLAARRFDLHYLIGALTTDVDDEHLLLWRTLTTLLRYPQLPTELMDAELRTLDPLPCGRLVQSDDLPKSLRLWDSLNVPPHPAFCYTITVPVDLNPVSEAPLVLKRTIHYGKLHSDERETKGTRETSN